MTSSNTDSTNGSILLLTVVVAISLVAHYLSIPVVPAQVTNWQETTIVADQHMSLDSL